MPESPLSPSAPPGPEAAGPGLSGPLLSALLHHSQSAMALSTWPEVILLDANPTWGKVTGLDPAQVKGSKLPHPELFPFPGEMGAILEALHRDGEITDAPLTLRCLSGGDIKHLLWSGKVVEISSQKLLVSSAVDITELKAARSALATSEAQFQWAFQASPDGLALVNASGVVLDMNPVMERLSGWSREEALGQSSGPNGLNFWVDPSERERMLDELLKAGFVHGAEARFRRKDLSEFTGALSATLLKRDGAPCVLSSYRDMTALREREAQLRFREERLQFSLEGAKLGSWDWDIPTGRMICDAQWAELFGFLPGELPPAHVSLCQALIHPEDRARVLEAIQRHLEGDAPGYECEFRVRHRKGHWFWVLDRGRVMTRDDSGRALRVCGGLQDISARKAMQAECNATNAQLQAILAALPDLLFTFSREGRFLTCHAPEGTLLLEPEAFLGRLVEEVLPLELARQTREAVEQACLGGTVQELSYALEMPQGRRHFQARIARISEDQALALTREILAP